jgi:nitrile hydratase subunit beta
VTRFSPGERVRVRDDYPPGHVRTPAYLRGRTGTIERCHGEFNNAETAAYGLSGPQKAVYKVRFAARELWAAYPGPERDAVEADIYEHWLVKII